MIALKITLLILLALVSIALYIGGFWPLTREEETDKAYREKVHFGLDVIIIVWSAVFYTTAVADLPLITGVLFFLALVGVTMVVFKIKMDRRVRNI